MHFEIGEHFLFYFIWFLSRISQNLNQFEQRQRYSAMNNSAFPAQVYTGYRGKPNSYNIHEGQLNFSVVETSGYKVSKLAK
jgi:hypothetical protein